MSNAPRQSKANDAARPAHDEDTSLVSNQPLLKLVRFEERIGSLESQNRDLASALEALKEKNRALEDETLNLRSENERLRKIQVRSPDNQCGSKRANDLNGGDDLVKKFKMTVSFMNLSLFDDDLVVSALSFLGTADLVSLAKTSKRFGLPHENDQTSLVERAACRAFMVSASQEEAAKLPKYADESHLELLRQLEIGRAEMGFDLLIGDSIQHEDPLTTSRVRSVTRASRSECIAVCRRNVMRAGKHFVQFSQTASCFDIGVIRPIDRRQFGSCISRIVPMPAAGGMDLSSEEIAHMHATLMSAKSDRWKGTVHCASYFHLTSEAEWTDWETHGCKEMENIPGFDSLDHIDSIVGLLLDLDAGTLSLFVNGNRIGLIKDGLAGEYCWFICSWSDEGSCRITKETMPLPDN